VHVCQGDVAHAQEPVRIGAEVLLYGDNTEFSNPFREGETLFGTAARVALAADIRDRATLTGGVFGNHRFGSDRAFETVRPVISLRVRAGASAFTIGTLPSTRPRFGPDRGSPHGLLPPIQRETLSFSRAYEAGLQWTHTAARARHDTWLNWQKLNTPRGREVFDAGVVGRLHVIGPAAVVYQAHIVHHGGQLHNTGPVSDSWVIAPGVSFDAWRGSAWRPSLDVYALVSRSVPDREREDRSTTGAAVFTRAALEHTGWRGHLIVWRSNDYIKEEGDPNYGGLRLDGTRFRRTRDYAEIGVTRSADLMPEMQLEGSVRLHRIDSHYEYSFRVLAFVAVSWPIHQP
jgi:hypothetical protein